ERDRPDVAARRSRWLKHRHRIDPARLVFIDESVLQSSGRSST
ncbi:hypothetical protein J2046_006860, partial [Rhizobium petrolearium]|nr:hypothetical protein [Neorhizobium petrolearium]